MRKPLLSLLAFVAASTLVHCSSSKDVPGGQGGNDGGPTTDGAATGDGGGTSVGPDGSATTSVTVTDITPDQALAPQYIGILSNGDYLLSEGQPLRVAQLSPAGHVVTIDSTSFTGLEWPRPIAVDDAGHVYILGYNAIHTFANVGLSGARSVWSSAGTGNKRYEWMAMGGTPKRVWAIPGPGGAKTQFVRFDSATPAAGGTPTVAVEVPSFPVMSFVVDAQNNIFAVDSNACRIRKVTPAGVVTVIAGKPEGEQGVCNIGSGIGRDSAGRPALPQANRLGFDPSGKILLLSGAGMLIDVTEGSDGLSKTVVLHKFEDGVQNETIASSADATYVVDVANKKVKKVVFH